MGNLKINWRRAALLFVAWTLVGLVFAAVSYGVALSQNDQRFGIAASLKLNLVLFYLWAFSHRSYFVFAAVSALSSGGLASGT
jgi:hypothetical protein